MVVDFCIGTACIFALHMTDDTTNSIIDPLYTHGNPRSKVRM